MHEPSTSSQRALVVGAGPAGAAAATVLAKAGWSVTVLDRARFPRDKCCGDGLTTSALRRLEALGLDPGRVASWQPVARAHVVGPRHGDRPGRDVVLGLGPHDGNGLSAAVARRIDLDAALLDIARDAGAEVVEGTEVVDARSEPGGVHVVTVDGEVRTADYAVAADGMWSVMRRRLTGAAEIVGAKDAPAAGRAPMTRGLGEWHGYRQYFTDVATAASRDLWVWFEADLLPGYLWSFPLPGGGANVGFGIERRPGVRTSAMKALWPDLLARPHVRAVLGDAARPEGSPKAWPIPAAVDRATLAHGRVLFAGDAAAACDVLTGEGIGQALQTGMAAATACTTHADLGPDAVALAYITAVRDELGPDHRMAWSLQRMLRSPLVCRATLSLVDATAWNRDNFGRWLFEDYPRGIALTPRRWERGALHGRPAYRTGVPTPAG